jgi:hypothetical protein
MVDPLVRTKFSRRFWQQGNPSQHKSVFIEVEKLEHAVMVIIDAALTEWCIDSSQCCVGIGPLFILVIEGGNTTSSE